MMAKKSLQLGRAVEWPDSPQKAQLDRVPNPQADTNYVVRFTAPEFTSICPVTGQPDFAHLVIDYVPGQWLLESKSLKLYVASFRNHGAFHEDCTVMIGKRIAGEIKPKFLRIGGYWYPRGGIPIDVFWQTGRLPKGMWIPDQGVAPYRGRGVAIISRCTMTPSQSWGGGFALRPSMRLIRAIDGPSSGIASSEASNARSASFHRRSR